MFIQKGELSAEDFDAALAAVLPHGARLFFIGIGGVSMSALAILAKEKGYVTGGSDRVVSATTENLIARGIPVSERHEEKNIDGWDAVIYNAAIGESNPEYRAAVRKNLPMIYRADFLAFLMREYRHGIGIAGMHGKSTTSAMLAHLFLYANRDPAVLIGASLPEMGGDFRSGHGDDFIFEACEYKDSFLSFRPSIAVVLNEEMDHPDYFHSLAQVRDSFHRYMEIPGRDGFCVVNADDRNTMQSAEGITPHTVTFAVDAPDADYRAENIRFTDGHATFDVRKHNTLFCRIALSVPGMHTVYDALACAAAADLCGIDAETIAGGLHTYRGAERRMECRGHLKGTRSGVSVPVYDDFAHHPSEVRTTLEGAARFGYKRLRCVYQPHTYSRTVGLFEEFCHAFDAADEVIFADIYAARETNTYGVSSEQLAARIPHASYMPDFDAILAYLQETAADGDLLLIMGAGDISRFAARIAE